MNTKDRITSPPDAIERWPSASGLTMGAVARERPVVTVLADLGASDAFWLAALPAAWKAFVELSDQLFASSWSTHSIPTEWLETFCC